MADESEAPARQPTTYMSKDGYALPIKQKHEASGLRQHAKAYIRRNQKISRLAKELLPSKHPDADVPLRSRARHLRPTRRHDDFSTSHKPVKWYDLGVPRCCGAFTPSTRLVSIRRGRGWFTFRF